MKVENKPRLTGRFLKVASPVIVPLMLGACVAPPVRTVAVPPPTPPQKVFIYPVKGQSPDQLERDRYECDVWAVQQSGVDPSRPDTPPHERVVVTPAPGSGAVTGAVGGAIVGSVLAGPRNAGVGLLFGGATGAIVGAAADANARAQAQQAQAQINQSIAADRARTQSYRRAIGACLEARGYTVS
jgi:hypothetical protein